MPQLNDLRLAALNRHRKKLFADGYLKTYVTTPADGETEAGYFVTDWSGRRVWATTDSRVREATGAWQFQIAAKEDWRTSQTFMLAITAISIGEQRWKVTKVEKPIGNSLVWKVKAQIQ